MNDGRRLQSFSAGGPRRLRSLGAGYSLFVRVAKIALPVAALIIAGIVVARLSYDPQQKSLTALPQADKTTPGQVDLVSARYEGADASGRLYTLSADKASRSLSSPDVVLLEKPEADMTLEDKSWLAARAAAGIYDNAAKTLVLKGGINVFHDAGYELTLSEISIDIAKRSAVTNGPVSGKGPTGTLAAAGAEIRDGGDLVLFRGPVKLTLYRLSGGKG